MSKQKTSKKSEIKIVRLAIHPEDYSLTSSTEINGARLIDLETQEEVKARARYSGLELISCIDIVYSPPTSVYDTETMEECRKNGAVFIEPLYRGGNLRNAANVLCPNDSPEVIERLSKAIEDFIRASKDSRIRIGNPTGYTFLKRRITEPPSHHLQVYSDGRWQEISNFPSYVYGHDQPERFMRRAVTFSLK